jgi:hypothetical protein
MRFLKHLRSRPADEGPGDAATAGPQDAGAQDLPIEGYDRLNAKQVVGKLQDLSQVQLEALEAYERSHDERPAVLAKLRYMRSSEPLEGYDNLDADAVSRALAGADAERVKAIRDYERKFQRRRQVLDEAARVLPDAPASAAETRAREEKTARVKASTRSRPGGPPA